MPSADVQTPIFVLTFRFWLDSEAPSLVTSCTGHEHNTLSVWWESLERVILLFSTNAHRVFHLTERSHNHPFVWWAQESSHTMCWMNAGLLKRCFKKVVIVHWCFCDYAGTEVWQGHKFRVRLATLGKLQLGARTLKQSSPGIIKASHLLP